MDKKEKILGFMQSEGYIPMTRDDIAAIMDVPYDERSEFDSVIDELLLSGKIISVKKKRLMTAKSAGFLTGRFSGNERGFGFVRFDDQTDDVFIPQSQSFGALDGDLVMISKRKGKDGRYEGVVEKILEHKNTHIVGRFQKERNNGFVIPDDKKISRDVYIPKKGFFGARDGQIVVCEIDAFPADKNPEGRIIEIIGYAGENDTVIKTVLKRYNIKSAFSDKVMGEAEKAASAVICAEGRLDLRGDAIITIDGVDSKDLDDAVSAEVLDNGNYRLGVHIADVSHYVSFGSAVDKEAYSRGTSVYLVDRVVPMLPKSLSNGVCSLQPNEDRLTLSCIMDIDKSGNVVDYKIDKSIIKSCRRMTYRGVTAILEGKSDEHSDLHKMLFVMRDLAVLLREKRMASGSLDFDFPESKILLDENGVPISVEKYEISFSNHIIEEFMLAANKTVAEHMYWLSKPMMYRVHESPDEDKLSNFAKVAHNLGYALKGINNPHPKAMQAVLDECKDKPEERVLSTMLLRSLMKAKYSGESLGHFGLNAKYYCHFTSPIRRYPDLTVHRLLKEWLRNGISDKREEFWKSYIPEAAENCSITERNAEIAERDVEDIKKAEYMKKFIGCEFEGYISSVTGFGFFVELDNTVEGLVHVTTLNDDYYIFDEKRMNLRGERTGRNFSLGDKVRVVCTGSNPELREIDFEVL